MDVHTALQEKKLKVEELADMVMAEPELLEQVLKGLSIQKAPVKFRCEKALRIISEQAPQLLYPHYDFFVEMLDNDNSFLRWGAIQTLGNLAVVDSGHKFDAVFDKYFAPIPGSALIGAANVIGGAARIAVARPELAGRITAELLKVEKASYQTPECLNVALGQVIDAFDSFFDSVEDKKAVLALVERQLGSTRNATRKRAERFLKRHGSRA